MPTFLIAGESARGKTSAVVQALGTGAFWICLERGALAVAKNAAVNPSLAVPDFVECLDTDKPFEEVKAVILKIMPLIREGKYYAVVMDTLSTWADREMARIHRNGITESYGRDTGKLKERITELMSLLMQVNCVFIALAHGRDYANIDGKAMPGGALLPGRAAASVPSLFDEVFHMRIARTFDGKPYRAFYADDMNDQYRTKDRYGVNQGEQPADLKRCLREILRLQKTAPVVGGAGPAPMILPAVTPTPSAPAPAAPAAPAPDASTGFSL